MGFGHENDRRQLGWYLKKKTRVEGLSKGREVGEFCVDSRTRGHPVWLEHKGQREKF